MGIWCLFHPISKGGLSNMEFERLSFPSFLLFDYWVLFSLECLFGRDHWFSVARTGSEYSFFFFLDSAKISPQLFSFVSTWRRSGCRDGVHDFHLSRSCKLRYPR